MFLAVPSSGPRAGGSRGSRPGASSRCVRGFPWVSLVVAVFSAHLEGWDRAEPPPRSLTPFNSPCSRSLTPVVVEFRCV